jgi:hypothetical protein
MYVKYAQNENPVSFYHLAGQYIDRAIQRREEQDDQLPQSKLDELCERFSEVLNLDESTTRHYFYMCLPGIKAKYDKFPVCNLKFIIQGIEMEGEYQDQSLITRRDEDALKKAGKNVLVKTYTLSETTVDDIISNSKLIFVDQHKNYCILKGDTFEYSSGIQKEKSE